MEEPKFVIAINHESGSVGREIVYKLGNPRGVNVYDKAIFDTLIFKFNLTVKKMQNIKAAKPNWWTDFGRFYQQFGTAGRCGYSE